MRNPIATCCAASLPALLLLQHPEPAQVDVAALLRETADRATLARMPSPPYLLCQASSLQIRDAGEIFDVSGPGAIAELFVPAGTSDLRYYLDDAQESVLSQRHIVDHASQAHGFPMPVPFARRCRVRTDRADGAEYRLEFRLYPSGTATRTFRREEEELLQKALQNIWSDPVGTPTFEFSLSEEDRPGGLICTDPALARGPRAVTDLHLRVESLDLDSALRTTVLRLSLDGKETVSCPLGEFFAVRRSPRPGPTYAARGIDERAGRPHEQFELVCRWVMPYRESFDLRVDGGPADLHVAGLVRTEPWEWDERTLHFHARSSLVSAGESTSIAGPGVLVGEAATRCSGRFHVDDETAGFQLSPLRLRSLAAVPFRARLRFEIESVPPPESNERGMITAFFYARPRRDQDPRSK